jgi:hypothetical protein
MITSIHHLEVRYSSNSTSLQSTNPVELGPWLRLGAVFYMTILHKYRQWNIQYFRNLILFDYVTNSQGRTTSTQKLGLTCYLEFIEISIILTHCVQNLEYRNQFCGSCNLDCKCI